MEERRPLLGPDDEHNTLAEKWLASPAGEVRGIK
jgi:hypothetical protein